MSEHTQEVACRCRHAEDSHWPGVIRPCTACNCPAYTPSTPSGEGREDAGEPRPPARPLRPPLHDYKPPPQEIRDRFGSFAELRARIAEGKERPRGELREQIASIVEDSMVEYVKDQYAGTGTPAEAAADRILALLDERPHAKEANDGE